jgi:hypothetical protein
MSIAFCACCSGVLCIARLNATLDRIEATTTRIERQLDNLEQSQRELALAFQTHEHETTLVCEIRDKEIP